MYHPVLLTNNLPNRMQRQFHELFPLWSMQVQLGHNLLLPSGPSSIFESTWQQEEEDVALTTSLKRLRMQQQ